MWWLLIVCVLIWLPECEPSGTTEPTQEVSVSEPSVDQEKGSPADERPSPSDKGEVSVTLPEPPAPEPGPEPDTIEPPPERRAVPEPPAPPVGQPYLYLVHSRGEIRSYRIDASTGDLTQVEEIKPSSGGRFAAFPQDLTHVYMAFGQDVFGFTLSAKDGKLQEIGQQQNPTFVTHIEIDRTGKFLFMASYGGNQVSMMPIGADHKPQGASFLKGSTQDTSYCVKAHQVRIHPNNKFLYVPCLGSDHVAILGFDAAKGTLSPLETQPVKKGAGPRHMDFHPSKPWAYVLNELNSTIDAFAIDNNTGSLKPLETISNLPAGTNAPSKSSDIQVSPDGRFLYAINREPLDNIGVYGIGADGRLTLLQHIKTGGNHARSMALAKGLPYLYVANTKAQSLSIFSRATDGKLKRLKVISGLPSQPFYVGVVYLKDS